MPVPRIRPYTFIDVNEGDYHYIGQVMSFVTPDQTVMVRRVPGHSGTLVEQPMSKLRETARKPKYVHYAAVSGRSSFPVDMLRYDDAAPLNFSFVESDSGRVTCEIDPAFGFDELIVATVSDTKRWPPAWTPERWRSFMWSIREVKTEQIGTE